MRIPFALGPDYSGQSVIADVQRTWNWMPELAEVPGGKGQIRLYPTPGVVNPPFAEFTESPGRGIFEDRGKLFTVIGQTLYEVTTAGVKTSRGTVARDTNPATLSSNGDGGDEVFITSGDKGYIWDVATSAFTTEVSSGVTMGGHLDGYFFYLDDGTSKLSISDLLDGKTWDATQFVQRSDASDRWKAVIESQGEIWAIGNKSGGVFYNDGSSPFPFSLRTESFFDHGIVAQFSLTRFAGTVAWLGGSEFGEGVVLKAQGYSPRRISHHAMETEIQGYSDITDAIGWSYEDRGHRFLVMEFPTGGVTWVYDEPVSGQPGMWHRRSKWDVRTAAHTTWRPRFHAAVFAKHLVCDKDKGAIYELNIDEKRDVDADPIRRERWIPHLSVENRQFILDQVEIELERGTGADDLNLLDINNAQALGAVGDWISGTGVSEIGRIIIADEGLVTKDLPAGIKTAHKVTLNSVSSTLVHLPIVLTAALYDIAAYVLAGGTWASRPNLLAESALFVGAAFGTTTAKTPDQVKWQRTSEPVTPVSTDLIGEFRIDGTGAGSFTAGDVFYFTDARLELDGGALPDPILLLSVSKDGGQTFGNEREVSAGQLGAYRARAVFRRFGLGRDWVLKVATVDSLKLIDGYVEGRPGAH